MTVAGDNSADGVVVDGNGSLTVQRAIIRNTGTAISITGSSALATLVNDTLVNNGDGVATANCGSIDMRNSILAFNQETALSYEACASTALHTYNLYWRNGHDFAIDGHFFAGTDAQPITDLHFFEGNLFLISLVVDAVGSLGR